MPSQTATAPSTSAHARMLDSVLGSASAFYASAFSQQLPPPPPPPSPPLCQSNNQDDNDTNDDELNLRLQQSIEKQEELVAAATAKAFANRSVSSGGGTASTGVSSSASSSHALAASTAIDGINPYVEQQDSGDELELEDDDDAYNNNTNNGAGDRSSSYSNGSQNIEEWENPSYLVKNLDTGESYNVEEIDQHYNLVTLDAVATQHELTAEPGDETSTSSYLLQLYTADETADIEIEEPPVDDVARLRTANLSIDAATDPIDPVACQFAGCSLVHQRPSGYCADHEVAAKESEDSRAQALYLIPMGARAEFVKISGHGFVYDAASRLYTVYAIEMRCAQSGASWVIYRRYQAFKALYDALRPLGVRVPLLPPKKLFGAFEPAFLCKRQHDLAAWLRQLLDFDCVDASAPNPHLLDAVRQFLTSKADQTPFLLDRLPLSKSRFFGASIADDDDVDGNDVAHNSRANTPRATLADFQMIQVIGRGSFGKVVLVGHRDTKKLFAMKILSKDNIVKRKQVEHTRTERRVLGCTTHPFIVGLHYAFQTPQRLYFVLDYCPGGELFYHLSRMKKLPEHMACFYAAEITLALEHLHGLGVVYRDLKPENILLTKDGHIKLADFGLAKEGIRDGVHGTNSLCGTPEYLPPEILDRLGHGTAVDWWNLGMVLYEMLTGLPPWYTNDRKKLFERLRSARLHFPPYVSRRAEALIRQLLNRNPAERLGSNGAHAVKSHLFFEGVDWQQLLLKQVPPPFRPCHTALNDGEAPLNFEAEFTRLPLPSIEVLDDASTGRSHSDSRGTPATTGKGATPRTARKLRTDSDTFQGFTFENTSLLEAVATEEASI